MRCAAVRRVTARRATATVAVAGARHATTNGGVFVPPWLSLHGTGDDAGGDAADDDDAHSALQAMQLARLTFCDLCGKDVGPEGLDALEHYCQLHGEAFDAQLSPFRVAALLYRSLAASHVQQLSKAAVAADGPEENNGTVAARAEGPTATVTPRTPANNMFAAAAAAANVGGSQDPPPEEPRPQHNHQHSRLGSHLLVVDNPYPLEPTVLRAVLRRHTDPVHGTVAFIYLRRVDIHRYYEQIAGELDADALHRGCAIPRRIVMATTHGPHTAEQRAYCLVDLLARLTQAAAVPRLPLPAVPYVGQAGTLQTAPAVRTKQLLPEMPELPSPLPAITVVTRHRGLRRNLRLLHPWTVQTAEY